DLALLVVASYNTDNLDLEKEWLRELRDRKTTVIGVMNIFGGISPEDAEQKRISLEERLGIPFVAVSAEKKSDRAPLLSAIVKNAPTDFETPTLTGDLFNPGDTIVLVAPQDIQAPKGRLILPQVQVIRDILDNGGLALVCTADNFGKMLESLKEPPALVITDSQVFAKVNSMLPRSVPLTSFSIIMARSKGELSAFIEGAKAIETLKPTDKILIAEACTHAPLEEDIGREKLPRWLRERAGEGLTAQVAAGLDFPKNIKDFALILHCGGCMFTRKQLMSRIIEAQAAGVPITNYGIAIAQLNGILDRVTEMFPKKA
ncbi:MAG: [FeFe] hydrogenase H-cluster maturation GTPase HydF, partial [Synergistes sp.]|nr:[FeFe] hydrogenase H-cluster maturation GTPase HydF [Synergistes sp.]